MILIPDIDSVSLSKANYMYFVAPVAQQVKRWPADLDVNVEILIFSNREHEMPLNYKVERQAMIRN